MAEKILDQERAAFELVARNNPHFSDCHTFTVSDGFDAYDEPDVQAAFEIWQAACRAVPAGWKLVPTVPTAEQLRAGYWSGGGEIRLHEEWARKESYERMVHATPDFK